MSDAPIPALGGKTPLEFAHAPAFAALAARRDAEVGRLVTVPEGFKANSDVANLGLLGLDPSTPAARGAARGPMEAAAAGISLGSDQIAYRANLVALGGDPSIPIEARTLADFTGGHVATERARGLIARVAPLAAKRGMILHAGVQYRHLLVLTSASAAEPPARTFAAHEEVGKSLGQIRPSGPRADDLWALVEDSARILAPEGLALWPWGGGRAMKLPKLPGGGIVITAVDLIRGLGRLRGLEPVDVPGATGWYDTDYAAKAAAAAAAVARGAGFVVVHVEAPDEAGHAGDPAEKVKAIESISEKILGPLAARFPRASFLVTADHPTFCATRGHGSDPVPYLLAGPGSRPSPGSFYESAVASRTPVPAWDRIRVWLEG